MNHAIRTPVLGLAIICTLALTACGEEEIPPERRCAEEGHALFGGGSLKINDSKPGAVSWGRSTTDGTIHGAELVVRFGSVDTGAGKQPVLMRLFASDKPNNLLDRLTELAADGAYTVTVADASELPTGSTGRVLLDRYDCDLSKGKLCVQLAVDSDGDGFITDADSDAFNGKSGSLKITVVPGSSAKLQATWSVDLSKNILRGMTEEAGTFQGCVDTKYRLDGSLGYKLD